MLIASGGLMAQEQQDSGFRLGHIQNSNNMNDSQTHPPQTGINNVVVESIQSIDKCYRGMHEGFNEDIIGDYIIKPLYKMIAIDPDSLCKRYLDSLKNGSPFEVNIPTYIPFVSINGEKYCKSVQQPPRC
jgi:hypothetical protein